MKVIVIGGSTAGMTAASKLKRMLKNDVEIIAYQKFQYPSLGACGIPYYVGKHFDNAERMIARTVEEFQNNGILVKTSCEVTRVDFKTKTIYGINYNTNQEFIDNYDKLIISVGATPRRLNLAGENATNVFTGTTLEAAVELRSRLKKVKNVTIIGGGFIGLEFCESFGLARKRITLIEADKWISRKLLDEDMAQLLVNDLEKKGIKVKTNTKVTEFVVENNKVTKIKLSPQEEIATDLVLVAIGVVPATKFLKTTDLKMNEFGAILVNSQFETNIKDVYAVGDCVMTKNIIDNKLSYMSLATIAAKNGKVLGNILAGKKDHFPGAIGTSIMQVFESEIARTGYTKEQAILNGFNAKEIVVNGTDHTHYVADAKPVTIKIIYDQKNRIIVGAQIFGYNKASLRINALIPIIWTKTKIGEIEYLDLPYSPPFAKSVDVLNVALAKINE
ncbi:FAD-dependent oxidoreductase [Spiroplasma melliferum]|uniref:NADH oxidase n=2 Tax=Spiroplasma melliferum TaxID=2134 RepID=A0AAI9T3P2_SPIME|nr:FAD-dependent oxidoreductase [Spiroplasma melliferum]ELL44729.1 NADH oxidase [Spiroplasma melliferum IPMB4A]KAI92907.1 NADH oxidase [Spiroplasma melliferum KC3]QCO23280.1 NADH oxidase [Spiroplasma melliferum]